MRFGHWLLRGLLREEADKGGTGGGEGGGTGAAGNGGAEPAVDAKALQAEIERLKSESAEKDGAIRYWHEEAKKGGSKQDPAAGGKQDDGATEEDLIEVASKGGVKAVAALLKKQGFVSADEVESRIETRARQIATETELAAKYPELKDDKSEFFKETAKHYALLTRDGVPKALAMKLAADQAALDGVNTGKRKTTAQLAEERKKEEADEKAARVRAQAADRSRGRQADVEDDNPDLDEFQKYICEVMEVDPDKYKKRAKDGVKVGGTR